MAIAIMVVPSSQIFANEKIMDSESITKSPIEFSTKEERASFAGTIYVTSLSGTPVKTYYVSGSGMSPSGQVDVSGLKKRNIQSDICREWSIRKEI